MVLGILIKFRRMVSFAGRFVCLVLCLDIVVVGLYRFVLYVLVYLFCLFVYIVVYICWYLSEDCSVVCIFVGFD